MILTIISLSKEIISKSHKLSREYVEMDIKLTKIEEAMKAKGPDISDEDSQ